MGLLSKLKSLLGMDEQRRTQGSGVDVTVERDRSTEADDSAEESAAAGDDRTTTTVGDEDDESVAAETTAAASTESLVDDDHTDDPTRRAEPGEAGVTGDEDADLEADDTDTAGMSDEATDESGDGDAEPVSSVKGIGPAYASRLEDAGVETVADLAAADPEDLAGRIDLSPKRVGRWVDNAQDYD